MKKIGTLLLAMCLALGACSTQSTSTVQTNDKGTQWEWKNGTIVVKTPERPAGQQSVCCRSFYLYPRYSDCSSLRL